MNSVKHVAIIMDGNGRWGIKHKKSRNLGHKEGLKTVEKIIKTTIKNKIKYLTLYAFSTENWKRPKKEINFLLKLLENFLLNKISDLNKQNIKLKIIGKKQFSKKINKLLDKSEKKTFKNKRLQINLAINYGSKSELIYAFNAINKNKKRINEKNISKNLFTQNKLPQINRIRYTVRLTAYSLQYTPPYIYIARCLTIYSIQSYSIQ